jgi:hypothetical protein
MTWKQLSDIILAQNETLQQQEVSIYASVNRGESIIILEDVKAGEHDGYLNIFTHAVYAELTTLLNKGENHANIDYWLNMKTSYNSICRAVLIKFGVNFLITHKSKINQLLSDLWTNQQIFNCLKNHYHVNRTNKNKW